MKRNQNMIKGFTLLELLIVIAIIGLLASVVIVSFPGVQDKSRAVIIVQDFQTIENALRLFKISENRDTWWRETYWTGGVPRISQIMGLSEFLPVTLEPPISGTYYDYDNDGDTLVEGNCGCCLGVNIGLRNCGAECHKYFDIVDNIIDNKDGRCYGRVRSDSGFSYIFFNMAKNENY